MSIGGGSSSVAGPFPSSGTPAGGNTADSLAGSATTAANNLKEGAANLVQNVSISFDDVSVSVYKY